MRPIQFALLSAGLALFAVATPSCEVDCLTTLTCDPPLGGTGGGGASSSQAASSSQTSTGAQGGGGAAMASSGSGGAGCIGVEGSGKDKTSCDAMAITPTSAGGTAASTCGPAMNGAPPGYAVCQHGFDVLTAGLAEELQGCLAKIPGDKTNACDAKQVSTCLSGSLGSACDRAEIATFCDDTAKLCKTGSLNLAVCSSNLRALNDAALDEYTLCMQTGVDSKDCQLAHDDCYSMILSS
jgi:hypothetical protein